MAITAAGMTVLSFSAITDGSFCFELEVGCLDFDVGVRDWFLPSFRCLDFDVGGRESPAAESILAELRCLGSSGAGAFASSFGVAAILAELCCLGSSGAGAF